MHVATRRSAAVAILTFVILATTGCLTSNNNIKVNADGSTVLSQEIILSPETVETLNEFGGGKLTGDEIVSQFEDGKDESLGDRDGVDGFDGVDIDAQPIDDDRGVGMRMIISFDDVETLQSYLEYQIEQGDSSLNFGMRLCV